MFLTVPVAGSPSASRSSASAILWRRSALSSSLLETTVLDRRRLQSMTNTSTVRPIQASESLTGRMSSCEPGRNAGHADIHPKAPLHATDNAGLHGRPLRVGRFQRAPRRRLPHPTVGEHGIRSRRTQALDDNFDPLARFHLEITAGAAEFLERHATLHLGAEGNDCVRLANGDDDARAPATRMDRGARRQFRP